MLIFPLDKIPPRAKIGTEEANREVLADRAAPTASLLPISHFQTGRWFYREGILTAMRWSAVNTSVEYSAGSLAPAELGSPCCSFYRNTDFAMGRGSALVLHSIKVLATLRLSRNTNFR